MTEEESHGFADLYASIRELHPTLPELPSGLAEEIDKYQQTYSRNYSVALFAASGVNTLVGVVASVTILLAGYQVVLEWGRRLSLLLSQTKLLKNHLPVKGAITCALLVVIVILVMPLLAPYIIRLVSKASSSFWSSSTTQRASQVFVTLRRVYIAHVLVAGYILLPIPLLSAYMFGWSTEPVLRWIAIGWLMVLVGLLSVLPGWAMFRVSVLLVYYLYLRKHQAKGTPVTIIRDLTNLIHSLDGIKQSLVLSNRARSRIVRSIVRISLRMIRMYEDTTSSHGISHWSLAEMRKAASNFASLAAWVYFPQAGTFEHLQERLCKYLAIFVSGRYHELPREETHGLAVSALVRQKKTGLQRILALAGLAVYTGLPIGLLALAVAVFGLDIPEPVQPLLGLLYIIWVLLGLFSLVDRLSPEARDFVLDITRTLIGKR